MKRILVVGVGALSGVYESVRLLQMDEEHTIEHIDAVLDMSGALVTGARAVAAVPQPPLVVLDQDISCPTGLLAMAHSPIMGIRKKRVGLPDPHRTEVRKQQRQQQMRDARRTVR